VAGHPSLAFVAAALVVLLVPRRWGSAVALAAPAVAGALVLAARRHPPDPVGFFGFTLQPIRLDGLSEAFTVVFLVVAAVGAGYGARTMGNRERAAALVYAGAGLGVVLAGDLLSLFVWWELKAVASAVLIALGPRRGSAAAALRYLVVHVVGGAALLGGMAWRLADGGSLAFGDLTGHGGATLILVAFLLSAAVPPLHAWLPDAYPEATVAGTVFLSAFTTKAAVYALARGFEGSEVLVYLGVFMALYGVVYAVLENEARRLLGYHIVSQVGFMVAAVGIGGPFGVTAATAHAFAHILYKGLLFMAVGAVVHATGRRRLSDLGGLARAMPVVTVCYLVGALSISGLPLLSGFVSKELVVEAARVDGRYLVAQLLKLASVGTFLSVGLKLPWFVFAGSRPVPPLRPVPATMIGAMALTAGLNLVIGVWPQPFYDLMPFAVDYQPYTAAKLAEVVQLLGFTALGFWFMAHRLRRHATVTLDTDWLYRATPGVVAGVVGEAVGEWQPRRVALYLRAGTALRRLAGAVTRGPLRPAGSIEAAASTTALGLLVLGAVLVVLAASVAP
jgi:multicomponent Na+:H+ antiporter subunit D